MKGGKNNQKIEINQSALQKRNSIRIDGRRETEMG